MFSSGLCRDVKKKRKEMVKRTKLKRLLEETLEVLSDIKLHGKITTISFKEVSKLHNDIEFMYKRIKKSTSKVDHSTLV